MRICTRPGLVLAAVLASVPVRAEVPALLGYQGRLLRADGTAATGTATVTFSLFAADTGGSSLWTESQTLGLSDGYYSTFLGLVTAPPEGTFDGAARWLEVRVGSETLVPRQRVGSAAFALTAQSVSGGIANLTSLKVGSQTVIDGSGRMAGSARYLAGAGISIDLGQVVSLKACPSGQLLIRDDSTWQCAPPNAGTVTNVGAAWPLAVTDAASTPQISLAQAGSASSGYLSSADWATFNSKFGALTQCGGDLAGQWEAPTVARLQSRPVAASAPVSGQVLKWNGAQWEPAADLNTGGTVTAVTGVAPLTVWNGSTTPQISMAAAASGIDGYLSSADWTRSSSGTVG